MKTRFFLVASVVTIVAATAILAFAEVYHPGAPTCAVAIAVDRKTGAASIQTGSTMEAAKAAAVKELGIPGAEAVVWGYGCAAEAFDKATGGWGASVRSTPDEASQAAVEECRKRTGGDCRIVLKKCCQ